MPKAILEFEMPENCWDCPLVQGRELSPTTWCGYSGKDCPAPAYQSRRSDCPLKLVKGCEYCNTEPEIIYRKDGTIFTKGEDKGAWIKWLNKNEARIKTETWRRFTPIERPQEEKEMFEKLIRQETI